MITNCRICLGENAAQDIYSLPKTIGVEKSSEEVILFCLGIELSSNPTIATKLCSKCHRLVHKYYRFKLLALESNSYLESLNNDVRSNGSKGKIKEEPEDIDENWVKDEDIKSEPDSLNDDLVEDITIGLNPVGPNDNCDDDQKFELMPEPYEPIVPVPPPIKDTKKKSKKKQKVKPICCQLCDKKFTSTLSMQIHQRKFHPLDVKKFQCDNCDQNFFKKTDLQQHIDKLHIEWKCGQCKTLFKSRLNYEKHSKTHDVNYKPEAKIELASNKKVCPVCGKLISHLSLHLARHKGSLYPCKGCDKKFSSGGARERHYKLKHQGLVYRCTLCGKDVADLVQHRKRYHNPDGLQYKCTKCSYSSVSASGLANHSTSHVEPHIPCPKCHKLFKNDSRLKMHCRQVHEGEVRHKCTECSKGFFYKSDLTIHMSSHTSEKPYRCDHCYEPFKLRRILIKHLKTKHNIN